MKLGVPMGLAGPVWEQRPQESLSVLPSQAPFYHLVFRPYKMKEKGTAPLQLPPRSGVPFQKLLPCQWHLACSSATTKSPASPGL